MSALLRSKFSFLGRAWCRTMHRNARWPIHGEYECSTCFRRYRVEWELKTGEAAAQAEHAHPKVHQIA